MQPNALAWVYTAKILGDRVRKTMPAWQLGSRLSQGVLLAFLLLISATLISHAQHASPRSDAGKESSASVSPSAAESAEPDRLSGWLGRTVREISFEGVIPDRLRDLPDHLPQRINSPLQREKVAESLRQLFATGLFATIQADAIQEGDGVK